MNRAHRADEEGSCSRWRLPSSLPLPTLTRGGGKRSACDHGPGNPKHSKTFDPRGPLKYFTVKAKRTIRIKNFKVLTSSTNQMTFVCTTVKGNSGVFNRISQGFTGFSA